MGKGRLEAFSDGVLAIVITIMVLELKVPHSAEISALVELWPVFLSYVLSFAYVGIYWNNHHHMLHNVPHVTGAMLWANLHLLFWLSLMPFSTGWMGENHFASLPVAVYGLNLLTCAIAYFILLRTILAATGSGSALARAVGKDWKGKVPLVAYPAGIVLAPFVPILSCAIYVGVALMWLIPDKRMEQALQH
jgi:uncharacterized membrane protein